MTRTRYSLDSVWWTIRNLFRVFLEELLTAALSRKGEQTALSQQSVLAWTHVFSPNLVNVARAGLNYLHTTRVSPTANDLSDIPGSFGILGIPQATENGGLPTFEINGLATLGTNGFLPSDEVSSTFQFTDDLTKIYSKHTFKMGMEWQHVKFSTLQPPWSKGDFRFQGAFVDIPGASPDTTSSGRAQFLLTPVAMRLAIPHLICRRSEQHRQLQYLLE